MITRLNLGCWQFGLQDWINVDINPKYGTEHWDVTKPPYEPNTVDEIYAGHLIEHLTPQQATEAIANWYNILKPKGKLTVTVPDYVQSFKLYEQGKLDIGLLNEIVFGDLPGGYEPNTHKQVTSEAIIHNLLNEFTTVKTLKSSPLTVADAPWQAIVEATK